MVLDPHHRNRKTSQNLTLSKAALTTPLVRLRIKVKGKFKGSSFSFTQRQPENYLSVRSSHSSKNSTDNH